MFFLIIAYFVLTKERLLKEFSTPTFPDNFQNFKHSLNIQYDISVDM